MENANMNDYNLNDWIYKSYNHYRFSFKTKHYHMAWMSFNRPVFFIKTDNTYDYDGECIKTNIQPLKTGDGYANTRLFIEKIFKV